MRKIKKDMKGEMIALDDPNFPNFISAIFGNAKPFDWKIIGTIYNLAKAEGEI